MKVLENCMKEIYFHGITLHIPSSMPHVAMNADGEVWCYDKKPYFLDGENEFDIDDGDQLRIAKVETGNIDWKTSYLSY